MKDVVDYIGESPAWGKVDKLVRKVAPIKTNVLLLGETGAGKEVVARALHRMSGRKGPFVAINCGAIPRDLFAAELFGYEAGAFTGAKEGGSIGKIEAAEGGTLFLDEIGEMPSICRWACCASFRNKASRALGRPSRISLTCVFWLLRIRIFDALSMSAVSAPICTIA